MDLDPFLRNTFWTVGVGSTLTWLTGLSIHPGTSQRFMALPSYNKARRALIYFIIGLVAVNIVTCILGMLIYTKYKDCDPTLAKVNVIIILKRHFHYHQHTFKTIKYRI